MRQQGCPDKFRGESCERRLKAELSSAFKAVQLAQPSFVKRTSEVCAPCEGGCIRSGLMLAHSTSYSARHVSVGHSRSASDLAQKGPEQHATTKPEPNVLAVRRHANVCGWHRPCCQKELVLLNLNSAMAASKQDQWAHTSQE